MSRRSFTTYADNDPGAGLRPFVCESSVHWSRRLVIGGAICLVLFAVALFTRQFGYLFLAVWVFSAFLCYVGWTWLQSRAWLEITPDLMLRSRRYVRWHLIDGADVRRVEEVVAGRSPDIRLRLEHGSYTVPTSLLETSHRVLYVWLAERAPQAEYDLRAERIRERLTDDGWLLALPGDR